MKNFAGIITATVLAVQSVSGHYIFQAFAPGSAKGVVYEYVRRNTNYNSPVTGQLHISGSFSCFSVSLQSLYISQGQDLLELSLAIQTWPRKTSGAMSAVPRVATPRR
jgi:hypothetical protein